ncbi:uncharacterized protein LOC124363013 [Homalodisca vitripennis]|uniref:uncharacterized protein LOC124363013 n=2 Tax=Homalodisca vitripennis TaxID=197043 RepID=UPI001EEC9AA0|nr:uncharacterized protein LOC124363013 [Homalodisca vitripennis]
MELKVPEVQSCCWCVSLRTGAKIFGFLSLVGGLLLSVATVVQILILPELPDEEEHKWLLVEMGMDLLLQIVHLTTSFFLLLGVYQEKRKLIPPWLVTTVLLAVAEVLFMTSTISSRFIVETQDSYTSFSLFLTVLDLMDEIYGFLVVYSYYRTLPVMDSSVV